MHCWVMPGKTINSFALYRAGWKWVFAGFCVSISPSLLSVAQSDQTSEFSPLDRVDASDADRCGAAAMHSVRSEASSRPA